jgi:hypothetical protein
MANRFQDNYRPQHSGDSVFLNTPGPINREPQHSRYDFLEKNEMNKKKIDNPYMDEGKSYPSKGGNISKSTENPYMDEGGSSVSRKPKTPSKSPSGGVALPIPQKVK